MNAEHSLPRPRRRTTLHYLRSIGFVDGPTFQSSIRVAFACSLLIMLLTLSGCDEDPRLLLIGKWQLLDATPTMTIDFREDGGFMADTPRGRIVGRWELIDSDKIVTWTDSYRPKRVNLFQFDDDILVIAQTDGVSHRHRRAPN